MTLQERAAELARAIYPHYMDDSKRMQVEFLLVLFAEQVIKECKPTAVYVGPYD
jgi:hypothetical protein